MRCSLFPVKLFCLSGAAGRRLGIQEITPCKTHLEEAWSDLSATHKLLGGLLRPKQCDWQSGGQGL